MVYDAVRLLSRWVARAVYGARVEGLEHVPREGAFLIAANHQSHLDPPLIGGMLRTRRLHFVARSGLFAFGPFGALIRALNSIPLRENSGDRAAIEETVRRLSQGRAVLIFPEGSRSPDGAVHEFKRGVALLVKRAGVPVVPCALEGCFDAFPRSRTLPRIWSERVALRFAPPISAAELLKDGPDAALATLARQIDAMRLDLRAGLRERTGGRRPRPGPGDGPSTFTPVA